MSGDSRFHSADSEFLQRYLAGCVVVAGDSTLYLDGEDPVHVAIIHDSSGFTPAAAIHVSDLHPDDALEQAHDALREHTIEHYPCHVKELQAEWGERWEEILTEVFDGMTWTLPVHTAASAICADRFAHKYVDIDT